MPKWLDTGTDIINLDYIERFQILEIKKERKGRIYVEKVILKAFIANGEPIGIAAFKNQADALAWLRTRLKNNEEKIIQVR